MSAFLEKYKELNAPSSDQVPTIPYVEMNAPIARTDTPKGDIGIEFEIEGRNLLGGGYLEDITGSKSKAYWTSKTDGSLRNGGREYVLSTPCYIGELSELVIPFFRKFETGRAIIKNSNRCSTHIHVNIGGYKINELTSAIALWKVFETSMLAWCGEERQSNHFCLSSKDETSVIDAWTQYLRGGQQPNERNLKYSALNVLTIFSFGSLEFRCAAGANEPTMPITWATFCYNLVRYAKEKYPNPFNIAYDISERGPETILKEICDCADGALDKFYSDVVNNDDIDFVDSCLEGFRTAQPFVMGFPWDQWMEAINKEYVPNPFSKTSKKKLKTPRLRTRPVFDEEPLGEQEAIDRVLQIQRDAERLDRGREANF